MQTIKFSANWNNKLGCKAFTTLRPANPGKYGIGQRVRIEGPKKIEPFNAEIVAITTVTEEKMSPFVAYLDTGYDVETVKGILQKMYKGKVSKFYLILLKRLSDE